MPSYEITIKYRVENCADKMEAIFDASNRSVALINPPYLPLVQPRVDNISIISNKE